MSLISHIDKQATEDGTVS